ncbi:MAG TPA: hypothetical protein VFY60_08870 [Pyrinomonadaceae bacterium]|nr:hypothetical protein [Pyrinomonadaceae bacterium]
MAEERTLGLARAQDRAQDYDHTAEEPSKEELQRRLGEARDSISNTVTEIKETVANQVQAVKDTLDWREQFKKRPVAWSAGAMGVGFAVGYCIAGYAKGEESAYSTAIDRYDQEARQYSAQSLAGSAAAMSTPQTGFRSKESNGHDSGPGFFQKVANTPAFERVREEAGNIGNAVVQELSNTAKTVVLPALITSLRNFIGDRLPNASTSNANTSNSKYQPSLERNQ